MKVMVTGASGLLGRAVCKELRTQQDLEVVGTAYARASSDLIRVNLLENQETEACVAEVKPDCIIHCAATRKPDICETNPDLTNRLNVEVTQRVAANALKHKSWMIHISTDYIFDGTQPPYTPEDQPNPLNMYAQSKLASEKVLPEILSDYCILRVPILYGSVESLAESPVTMIAQQLLQEEKPTFDHWATRYPTHTGDVAYVLRQMIERKLNHPELGGICHFSGSEAHTKYTMARVMCDIMNIPVERIAAAKSAPAGAPRPQNTHLDCQRLESLGICRQTTFEHGVAEAIIPFM
jgi:dTDP-4-dehydrorhamnose reductase